MVKDLLLKLYAQGSFAVPLSTPNRTFKPQGLKMWAKFQLMPTSTYKGNLRETEKAGILQVTLFVPIGTDDTLIDAKANDIVNWFGTEVQHSVQTTNFEGLLFASKLRYSSNLRYARNPIFKDLTIMSSHIEPAMPDSDGKWYMQPISIEYQVI